MYDQTVCLQSASVCAPLAGDDRRIFERFPEENVTLRFSLASERHVDYKALGTRERLFRRIVATLYRGGIINRTSNVVEAGMAVGDNAVPFASMLRGPGVVYAIDPMLKNCETTTRLACWNGIRNLCLLRRAVGESTGTALIKRRQGPKLPIPQVSLDSLRLSNVGLVHLDVEGFEERAVRGAQHLIRSSLPVVVTERHANDVFEDQLLLQHGYAVAEIPEICGPTLSCRNRLWIPKSKWAESMRLVGKELARALVPEHSPSLRAT